MVEMKAAGFLMRPSSCSQDIRMASTCHACPTHLSPLVIHRDDRRVNFLLGNDGTGLDEGLISFLEDSRKFLEGIGNNETSGPHSTVLSISGLHVTVGHGTSVAELHLGGEHLGASTNSPGDDRLGNLASPDGLDDTIFLNTPNFTKKDKHLALRIGLVAEEVVDEGRTGVAVTTDGDTLVGTVGDEGEDVVQLVRHTTRFRDVTDGTRTVELGRDDVVHHATGVTNPEAAGLDTADSSGSDNKNTLLLGYPKNLASVTFRDTLSDESNSFNLRELEALEGARVHTTAGSEVDDNIDLRVFGSSLLDAGVDGKESFLGTPVELLDVVTAEGVDHGSDGGSGATTGVIEVEHTLDGTRLETVYKGTSVSVERPEPGARGG